MKEGKREDLTTFNCQCPIWEANGRCFAGWKCRFVGSHSKEIEREDGRKELVLIEDKERVSATAPKLEEDAPASIVNSVSTQIKFDLSKRKIKTDKADAYCVWLDEDAKVADQVHNTKMGDRGVDHDNRAQYKEAPFLPSEKRKIYFGVS